MDGMSDASVPRALQRVIQREHCDLLVMGSSRHAAEGRVRIGRRTRQLLSSVECAMAIAPRGMHSSPEQALKRVGVGYDGGPESEAALALASALGSLR
jgi:nucleotide-binding universal stress UspA family protein